MKKIISLIMMAIMVLAMIPFANQDMDVVSAASEDGGGGTTVKTPYAPTNLAFPSGYKIGSTEVKLSWSDKSNNETEFRIERSLLSGSAWSTIGSVDANATTYNDNSVKPSTAYKYRVYAYNSYGYSAKASNVFYATTVAVPAPVVVVYQELPSAWAVAEIEKAKLAELTVDNLLSEYNKPITRAEFSQLVVKLYEKATGKIVVPVSPNPFTDTTNEAVLKAYAVGIINGVSADKFAPDAKVTRQEMSVMLQRELQAASPEEDYKVSDEFATVFADENQIAIWAIEAIRFMNQEGIVNGIGGGKIDPIGNATREQAMLMVYRDYTKFVVEVESSI